MNPLRQSALQAPAAANPSLESEVVDSRFIGPLAKSFAIVALRCSAVTLLLCSRCPHAIRRFVIAVVVSSLKLMVWRRPLAHVSVERFKPLPASADGDSAPAVTCIAPAIRIGATLPHRSPCMPLRRVRHAMRDAALAILIDNQASARFRAARFKAKTKHLFRPSAITATQPARFLAEVWHSLQHREAMEFLSGQVFGFVHYEPVKN
jgi:hypothetical protein